MGGYTLRGGGGPHSRPLGTAARLPGPGPGPGPGPLRPPRTSRRARGGKVQDSGRGGGRGREGPAGGTGGATEGGGGGTGGRALPRHLPLMTGRGAEGPRGEQRGRGPASVLYVRARHPLRRLPRGTGGGAGVVHRPRRRECGRKAPGRDGALAAHGCGCRTLGPRSHRTPRSPCRSAVAWYRACMSGTGHGQRAEREKVRADRHGGMQAQASRYLPSRGQAPEGSRLRSLQQAQSH